MEKAETGASPSAGNDRPALMMAGHAPPVPRRIMVDSKDGGAFPHR